MIEAKTNKIPSLSEIKESKYKPKHKLSLQQIKELSEFLNIDLDFAKKIAMFEEEERRL